MWDVEESNIEDKKKNIFRERNLVGESKRTDLLGRF